MRNYLTILVSDILKIDIQKNISNTTDVLINMVMSAKYSFSFLVVYLGNINNYFDSIITSYNNENYDAARHTINITEFKKQVITFNNHFNQFNAAQFPASNIRGRNLGSNLFLNNSMLFPKVSL